MVPPAFVECERIVNGLVSYTNYDKTQLNNVVREVTFGTIQYILDGHESLDDLEACEKTVFGTKFEKRFLRRLDLPRKTSRRNNPHDLKLDTRIAGFEIDVKTTLGHRNWMVPNEAVGSWLFLVRVAPKTETVSYGLFKAIPIFLNPGRNRDQKVSISRAGKHRINWIAEDLSYRPAMSF